MNPPTTPTPARPLHVGRWILIAIGVCLTPILVLGALVASCLMLDRDAAVLRRHIMAATNSGWETKVQLSLGGWAFDTLRTGLIFVRHPNHDVTEARQALAAVRGASVGIYARARAPATWSNAELLADTDRAMQARGWTRLVGVADKGETVMIFAPRDCAANASVDLCLAVVNTGELVVVSTTVDGAALGEIVARHSGAEWEHRFHFGHLRL